MKITFIPLAKSHFSLLLEWLETPHVKTWWDQDLSWTYELIQKKYTDYVKGYKLLTMSLKQFMLILSAVMKNQLAIFKSTMLTIFQENNHFTDYPRT